jgi:hypothetical protein
MPTESPIPHVPVLTGPEAEGRLRQIGLSGFTPLIEALRDGAGAARSTTEFHPRSYPGQRMWAETHASLAHRLRGEDWTPDNFFGADLLVCARKGTAIVVTAGDSATGREGYLPQVRYERREVITGLVNGHADSLFMAGDRPEWSIWFLLHHLASTGAQAELSKPATITKTGWVYNWEERILFPESDMPERRRPSQPADIEVPVERRVG